MSRLWTLGGVYYVENLLSLYLAQCNVVPFTGLLPVCVLSYILTWHRVSGRGLDCYTVSFTDTWLCEDLFSAAIRDREWFTGLAVGRKHSGLQQSARPHIREKWSNSRVPAACKQPMQLPPRAAWKCQFISLWHYVSFQASAYRINSIFSVKWHSL